MYPRWRIIGQLTTISPLHIGNGDVVTHDQIKNADGPDGTHSDIQAVVRDQQGRPCIPGSALKGVLRSWAEQFLDTQHRFQVDRIFGPRDQKVTGIEAGWGEFCAALSMHPDANMLADFEKFVPYWRQDSLTGVMSHVCIDRETGAAAHNKLFYEEFVPERIAFRVEIDATRLKDDEIALLLAILEQGASHPIFPYQFGANGADGWGRMQWKLVSVQQCQSSVTLSAKQAGFDCCTSPVQVASKVLVLKSPAHLRMSLTLAGQGTVGVNASTGTSACKTSPHGGSRAVSAGGGVADSNPQTTQATSNSVTTAAEPSQVQHCFQLMIMPFAMSE